ncbi:MAG TPA: hypothetical protein VIH59_29910 [Candidatus Tectomicrobia bacterium]
MRGIRYRVVCRGDPVGRLARLWQRQSKRTGACRLLVEYGWCTAGLDTAALQEARALRLENYPGIGRVYMP